MGKCLKCSMYKLVQFGRRALAKRKISESASIEDSDQSKYNSKKIKLIYGKEK